MTAVAKTPTPGGYDLYVICPLNCAACLRYPGSHPTNLRLYRYEYAADATDPRPMIQLLVDSDIFEQRPRPRNREVLKIVDEYKSSERYGGLFSAIIRPAILDFPISRKFSTLVDYFSRTARVLHNADDALSAEILSCWESMISMKDKNWSASRLLIPDL